MKLPTMQMKPERTIGKVKNKKDKINKIKQTLGYIMVVLSIMGLVTFSLFILEESIQTAMFGIWPAQDAGDWRTVKQGIEIVESTVTIMDTINYSVGWIQPLSWVAYRQYSKSARHYVDGAKAKCFNMCPECFEGERMQLTFRADELSGATGRYVLRNNRISVHTTKIPEDWNRPLVVSGIVRSTDTGKIGIWNAIVKQIGEK